MKLDTELERTLLDRVLHELGKKKMNRRDVAERLIAELRSRKLVTSAEANNLTTYLKIIVPARVIDAALVKKMTELAGRFPNPGSVAGTIANTTVRVARAMHGAHPDRDSKEPRVR